MTFEKKEEGKFSKWFIVTIKPEGDLFTIDSSYGITSPLDKDIILNPIHSHITCGKEDAERIFAEIVACRKEHGYIERVKNET